MRHEVILCVRSAHHEREESLSAGVPLKGPGSSRVLDALWCNLGLIFKHFFSILMATILLEKWLIPIMICFSDPHPLPRPCFRANRKTVANCTSQVRSAKSLSAGGRGPLKGPGSSRVLDALWCNLGLIFKPFFSILMATILLEKGLIHIMICHSEPPPPAVLPRESQNRCGF